MADSPAPCLEYLAGIDADHVAIGAAIARAPLDPLPVYDVADLCRSHGRIDLWERAVNWATELPHDSRKQIHRRGAMKLLREDWSGWLDLESRIYDPAAGYLDTEFVRHLRYETLFWNGRDDLAGRTILVIADGSLGDCLQMLRYVPLVARRAGRVILSVRPEAARFVREVVGSAVTMMLHGASPDIAYDYYVWLMSLPALLDTLPPPLPVPFHTTPISCTYGVYWTSDLSYEGVRWLNLREPAAPLVTLFEAAKVVTTLSGIVTIDTTVAHLAGTLGVPTWLLLETLADARWGLGQTTPWYPCMRIIRQQTRGEWTSVIAELRASIDASLASPSQCA